MALTLPGRARPRTADRSPSRPGDAARRARFEPHIQGLRAIAVASVVLYHLWPERLPGGFVGVDVFFVISGYLISGHLLREIETTGSIRILDFWARRIRRLLPAAVTVLVAASAFVLLAMPAVDWAQNLQEIRAAALYAENWQLVANAIDYLAAQNAPSLVQHFWSLSVEEQFYFVQPLVLLVALRVFRSRRIVAPVLAVAFVVSLTYSVLLTASDPGTAYFSTGTRAWEFALGGIAALVAGGPVLGRRVTAALGWAGLGLIAVALVTFTGSTPFPSWTAGVPVLGTALALLFAGGRTGFAPGRILGAAPLRVTGDWSYSIYLWHWPLIVAVPVVLGREPGWKVKLGIVVVSVVLAALTKRYVEDRFRRAGASAPVWRTFAVMAVTVALVAAGTTAAAQWQASRTAELAGKAQAALAAAPERCLGAAAVLNGCDRPYAVTDTIVPAAAADDVPWNVGVAASKSCPGEALTDAPRAHACVFNDPPRPTRTVALVGDSHADHLIDALNAYATDHRWRFITYTREGCGGVPSKSVPEASCRTWSTAVQRALLDRKDVDAVVFSNYTSAEHWTVGDAVTAWKALVATGRAVVPIVDVPGMPSGTTAPKCVAAHLDEYDPCSTAPPKEGKLARAAAELGVPAVSINDVLCQGGRCHAVIGGQIVYMDEAHLTFHFAVTLRNVLGSRVEKAIVAAGPAAG